MATDHIHLKFFADYIEKEIGIIYSDANYFQLEHRLNDIATLLNAKDISGLWEKAKLGIDGQMRDLLLDLATNNETSFFRDAQIFKALTSKIIPELLNQNPNMRNIRIWSAAGSTGQEAYSIVMCMLQQKKEIPMFPDFELLVTDVSERVLNKAREGVYSQLEVQRGLSARMLIQYFDKINNNDWKIKNDLKAHLKFKKMNLLDLFPRLGEFDIIFCRNVLIYQSIENKSQVVKKFVGCLSDKGFLVLGAAESMLGVSQSFDQVSYENTIFYRKK